MSTEYCGGCHCGALRYRSTAPPVECGYCHCRDCQLLSGAPAVTWASFPVQGFEYTRGQPRIYKSSDHARREFCEVCGSEIAFRETREAETVDVASMTLDEPEQCAPDMHIFVRSRISWFDVTDDLPRFEGWRSPAD